MPTEPTATQGAREASVPPGTVDVLRRDTVESRHRVHVAVADAHGRLVAFAGDPRLCTFSRSTLKPFQLLPFVRDGGADALGLPPHELAVAAGSHNGEPAHLEAVRSLLRRCGLEPRDLQCGADPPLHGPTAKAEGGSFTELHNNCSGKHAAMLAACQVSRWPLQTYLEPGHPLQVDIRQVASRFLALPADRLRVGTDGCSAPNIAAPLGALAAAFARLIRPPDELPEGERAAAARITTAMAQQPWFVGGSDRFDTAVMEATRGRVLSKAGGEATQAFADARTGLGVALKVEDGAWRAVPPASLEVLRQLDWLSPEGAPALDRWARPPVLNQRGLAVGRLVAALSLQWA